MLLSRSRAALLALAVVSALALNLTPALAYVNDIRSALLPASSAPPGFSAPEDRVFPHFQSIMSVKTLPARRLSPVCVSQKSFAQDGWKQGMIETFPARKSKPYRQLTLCAWRFKSVGGARSAYALVAGPLKVELKPKKAAKKSKNQKTKSTTPVTTLKLLSRTRIGDASIAVQGVTTAASVGYEIYFRHANALVKFNYYGPSSSFSASGFLSLAKTVNAKLR